MSHLLGGKKLSSHINNTRYFTYLASTALFCVLILSAFAIVPASNSQPGAFAATGTATAATTSITIANLDKTSSINVTPTSDGAAFASGGIISFDVTTNNNAGYIVELYDLVNEGKLINTEDNELYLEAITDNYYTNATFPTNKWGIKPSSYVDIGESNLEETVKDNTGDDAKYIPFIAESSGNETIYVLPLDLSSSAGSKSYTIETGAKVDNTMKSGAYESSFSFLALAAPTPYSVAYSSNTEDTVTNMPATQSSQGGISETTISLSNLVPERAHYSFTGWCSVQPTTNNGTDSCSGTVYNPDGAGTNLTFGIDQTTTNTTTLYAMWQIDTFTCTKQYRLENADGTWGEYIIDEVETINYGAPLCSYSKTSPTGYHQDEEQSLILGQTTENVTRSIDFYRNLYSLNRTDVFDGETLVNSPISAPRYRWGSIVTLTENQVANTTCTGYNLPVWTTDDVDLDVDTGYEISFIMPMHSVDITMTSTSYAIPQEVTLSKTGGASGITIDGTTYTGSTASLTCDTHTISGVYTNGYSFDSWSAANGVTVADTTAASTTITVSEPGSLTLNGKSLLAMQNVTMSDCPTTPTQVYDNRDGTTYTIGRLADGKCWLLDNLALDLTDTTILNGLSALNTNASDASLISLRSGNRAAGQQYATSGVSDWVSESNNYNFSFSVPLIKTIDKDVIPSSGYQGKVGVYYNYCAASAGSYCYGDDTTEGGSSGNATNDICPFGWSLPTQNNYYNLYLAYDSVDADYVNALRVPFSGYVSSGSPLYQGSYGYFWMSTKYTNTHMMTLGISGSRANVYNESRDRGRTAVSVRCILDATTISDITTMQQFGALGPSAKANVINSMVEGQAYTLTDARADSNGVSESYSVAKLADGNVWLLDNLRLDLTDATVQSNLTSSTTNASDTTLGYLKGTTSRDASTNPDGKYATAGVTSSWSTNSYSAPLINTASKKTTGTGGYEAGKYGVYYNYCAASAGSYCYGDGTSEGTSSGNATEDICPKGWRMPTSGASGEHQALYDAYGSDDASFIDALRTPLPGSFSGGHAGSQGSSGFFWSSTRGNNSYMYALTVTASSVRPQNNRAGRANGFSVRCILK